MSCLHGPYTFASPELRARALECAKSPRQRALVMGTLPWSALDKPKWNQHHYRRFALNLVSRIRAAGIPARFHRHHVYRGGRKGATHRLVLLLGDALPDNRTSCICQGHITPPAL